VVGENWWKNGRENAPAMGQKRPPCDFLRVGIGGYYPLKTGRDNADCAVVFAIQFVHQCHWQMPLVKVQVKRKAPEQARQQEATAN